MRVEDWTLKRVQGDGLSGPSDAEAASAAAAGGGVGVGDLEGGAAEALDIVDRAASDEIEGHRIDDERDSVLDGGEVLGGDLVGEAEAIGEAGAAAAVDREPEDRG